MSADIALPMTTTEGCTCLHCRLVRAIQAETPDATPTQMVGSVAAVLGAAIAQWPLPRDQAQVSMEAGIATGLARDSATMIRTQNEPAYRRIREAGCVAPGGSG